MKKTGRLITILLVAAMMVSVLSGCGGKNEVDDGKVKITIGSWPDDTNPNGQKVHEEVLAQMNEKYPNVIIEKDNTKYSDAKLFQAKAAADKLPTLWPAWFTEVNNYITNGYAADITDILKKKGMLEDLNPQLLEMVTSKDGGIYAFPTDAYAQGLTVNKVLFEQAGLVNEDGTVKEPSTYEELAEFAKIIKEKTGKPGFAICTAGNQGGWQFMNIAWSYGVEFMKQREDGSWEATFNTQEMIDALQYVKDLKWKYDVLPTESVLKKADIMKYLAIDEVGMIIQGPSGDYASKYGMDPENLSIVRLPAGPNGRVVQMGGNLYAFSSTASDEQLSASIDWLKQFGYENTVTEEQLQNIENGIKETLDNRGIVFPETVFPLWVNGDLQDKKDELLKKYTNVSANDYEKYYSFEDCKLRPEEPVACQQLYSILDGCIQEVLTNKDADVKALVEVAAKDFQNNHLDKLD